MKRNTLSIVIVLTAMLSGYGQSFDLQQLLKDNKLQGFGRPFEVLAGESKKAIRCDDGTAWIKGVNFSTGTIEVDLRGRDVFQQSFVGIGFHGEDAAKVDVVYFRPFNFRAADPVRKIHAVQYMSLPDYDWSRLRKEHEGVYEKEINPPPAATEWFHARIVVGEKQIQVYVNGAKDPALTVDKLNDRKDGMIGLWANGGQPADFANLVIRK
jgi:hypothetical protein